MLRRRSERKITSQFKSAMAFIFFSCLGQLVETLRELQFWIPKLRLDKTAAKETTAWAAGWLPCSLAMLGDRRDLDHIPVLRGVQRGLIPVQDVQGDYCVQLQMDPVVSLSCMGTKQKIVNIYLNFDEGVRV